MRKRLSLLFALAVLSLLSFFPAVRGAAEERPFIFLGSTTTTYDSGLLDHILPRFTEATGIEVRSIIRGTGQILELGRRGDLDALLVHHRPSEEAFIAQDHGLQRIEVMYNDFVLVGPEDDPAKTAAAKTIEEALSAIAAKGLSFLSRGDESGTHKREVSLWTSAGLSPWEASGGWYRETGSGMGATLNNAAATGAYVITDRGTWAAFRNKQNLALLFEGGPDLANRYAFIPVNPERHPHVKYAAVKRLADWLTSGEGRAAIAGFQIDGQQLFFPSESRSTAGERNE